MKRKLVSYICLMAIFMESVPVNALSNITSEVIPLESLEKSQSNQEVTEQEDENLDNKEANAEVKEDASQGTESKPKLEDNVFNMYILDKIDGQIENELAFSIGFDEKESKLKLSNQSEKQLSKENLDTIIYKINIYDKENKEKLNIELLGKDTGNSEKLNILKGTKYEIGDTIKITSFDPKNGLKILGEIQGDIKKEKQTDNKDEKVEDYSDGVDNLDYLDNVRFEITETNLKTVYNEAPVFEGLDKADENLNGLKVTDDHDGVIPNSNVIVTQEGDYIIYQVTDSWGRTVQTTKSKYAVYTQEGTTETPEAPEPTLADNTITVKGIPFVVGDKTNDVRFKINFDTENHTITVTDQDGKIFSTSNAEYFKFALHGSNGKVKHEVKLNGRDRSDSKKLDAINNIQYEIGDYISISIEDSKKNLSIDGIVSDDVEGTSHDFSQGVVQEQLKRRFKLTETGLQLVTNLPPVIKGADTPLKITRGDTKFDLLAGVTVEDALDGTISNSEIKIEGLDINTAGVYNVKYIVEDSWGVKAEVTRTITVSDTNDIDGLKFDIMTKDGSKRLFTVGFDELLHEIKITNKDNSGRIDSSSNEDAFILKLYNQFGKVKKTFKIKGNTDIENSNVLTSMNGYKYVDGDYVTVYVANKSRGIQVHGNIQIENKNEQEQNTEPEPGPGGGTEGGDTAPEQGPGVEPTPEPTPQPGDGTQNESSTTDQESGTTQSPEVVNHSESVNDSDYVDDPIQNFEDLDHTRFRLKGGKVTAIYNEAPQINGVEDKIIKRGEGFNPLENVTVSDDRDKDMSEKDIKITYPKGITADNLHLIQGKHIVKYRIKDSWGRETVVNRTITVDPKNELEKAQITLKSNSESSADKDILKIGFDTINNRLRVEDYNKYLVVEGNKQDTALKITIYGKDKEEKSVYELKQETRLTTKDIDEISNMSYVDGDLIAVEVYDAENRVSITGTILTPEASYNEGFKPLKDQDKEPEDIMKNTRFIISNNGLDDDYNEAPEIIGADEVMVVKNHRFEPRLGVSVNDEDEDLGFRIENNGILDTSEIGTYTLTYWTIDSWGRVSSVGRVVHVVPEYADTHIELKNTTTKSTEKPLLSIGINRFGNRFVLNSEVVEDAQPPQPETPEGDGNVPSVPEEEPSIPGDAVPETLNASTGEGTSPTVPESNSPGVDENAGQGGQTHPQTDESLPNEGTQDENIIFKLTVFNNNEKVNQFTLSKDEVITSQKKKELEDIILGEGYTFSIWSKNHRNLSVKGEITKDRTDTNDNSDFTNADYSDGIDSQDLMDNVRFTINGENLQALYNSKPVITIADNNEVGNGGNVDSNPEGTTRTGQTNPGSGETTGQYKPNALIMYRGETPNLKKGVSANDHRDGDLDLSGLKITIEGEEFTISNEEGKKAVRDKLEELSLEYSTNGTVYKGELEYQIADKWGRLSNEVTRQIVIKPGMDRHEILLRGRMNVGSDDFFDAIKIKFDTTTKKFRFLHREDEKFGWHGRNFEMYSFEILGKDGTSKGRWTFTADDNATNEKYNDIQTIDIQYGDKIKLTTNQGPKLSISGEIHNTGNDYTDGVTGHMIANTEFEITENGLVENYVESIKVPEGKNMISILTGFVGTVFFNITYNLETKKLEVVPGNTKEPLEYRYSRDITRFEFFSPNSSSPKRSFTLYGHQRNDSDSVIGLFQNFTLNPGDYFTMVPLYEPNKKLFRILGEMEIEGEPEDFSDGVDNIDEVRNTRFYITDTGKFKAVHNEAPVINVENEEDGVVNIPLGEEFTPGTGVTVKDDKKEDIRVTSRGNVNTNAIGNNQVTYTATDSWGRETTKTVTYKVRPKSFFNKINVYTKSDTTNPGFEISFDNETNKYTVKTYSDKVMDSHDNSEPVFKIWILSSDNSVKGKAELLGHDQANSSKLNVLNNVDYAPGDKIKVWRYSNSDNVDTLKITGPILGNKRLEDYSDGIQHIDNINNVVFEVTDGGFRSIYNHEAEINGVEDKVVYIGDNFDPKDGLEIEDAEDGQIDINDMDKVEIEHNVKTDRTGKYEVTYTVRDSWDRYSQKTITIHVVSKSTKNTFEFYQDSDTTNDTNTPSEKLFTIGLDYETGKYKVDIPSNSNIDKPFDSEHPTELYAKIVVYDRYGKVLKEVELLGNDTPNSEKLAELNKVDYGANQTISLYHKKPQKVVIKEQVLSSEGTISRSSYDDGFDDKNEMEQTRFKITDNGLLAVKHKDAEFTWRNQSLTITRGDDVDLREDVTITHPTDEVQLTDVTIENFNKFEMGTQIVTYKYVDSWGITSTATREVIVNPINDLEANVVEIINNSRNHKKVGEISFDTINMKLYAKFDKSNLEGIEDSDLLTISLFDMSGESKHDITITKQSIMDGSTQKEIEKMTFDYDDYISYKSYDSDNGFAIRGNIKDQKEEYDDGVQNKDHIENVRFIIEEAGLKSKYNNAPVIKINGELETYKGEEPDFTTGVTITDDIDKTIDPNNITIVEDFSTETLGKQTVTYRVEDSWGRQGTATRDVWVKSLVDTNKAGFYNSRGQLIFAIGFNSKTKHYTLEKGITKGPIVPEANDEVVIKIHIFEDDGRPVYTIPIRGNKSINASYINLLPLIKYKYGRSINIEILDYDNVKFKGDGEYFKDGFEKPDEIDYNEQFITKENRDYLDNVRFKITELGMQAMYNKAPKIEIEKGEEGTTNLERDKYKTLDEYNLLEGVTVSDDREELSKENIVITKVENSSSTEGNESSEARSSTEVTPDDENGSNEQGGIDSETAPSNDNVLNNENANKKLVLGTNRITYHIKDGWGRKSEEVTRTVNISPSINKNIIQFERFVYKSNTNIQIPERELAVELRFDHASKTIKANKVNDGNFGKHGGDLTMYRIEIGDKSNPSSKFAYNIKDNHSAQGFVDAFNDEGLEFKYGDTIKMTTTQGPMHKIQGPVIGGGEDYSDGTHLSYILANTTFTITENGLEAEVIDNYQDRERENTITWLAGYNGLVGFRMTLDRQTMTLDIKDKDQEKHIDTEDHSGKPVFSIKLFDANGNQKYNTGQSRTDDYGVYDGRDEVNNSVVPQYHGMEFSVGDYFEIKIPKTSRSKNLRISGHMKIDKRIDEEYEDGIDNTDWIDNIRLYITDNGLEAKYNEAPVVTGAEDGILVKYRDNKLPDVTIKDDHDKDGTIKPEVIGDVNTMQIGAYMVSYKATDSWGRSSEFDRFVVVQAPPRIELNKGSDLTLELGSMPQDKVDYYLKERLVAITDEEDDRDGKDLKITIDDDGFDPDKVGSYDITYTVVDSDGHKTIKEITVNVVRSINVSVPTTIPFQVVTNLKDKSKDPFISGVLNLKNNLTSEVDVFVESFTKQTNSGELELVDPEAYDWEDLSSTETMKKMALGMYVKSGLTGKSPFVKESPLWLKPGETNDIPLGRIPRAQSIGDPSVCKLSFTSKHGKNFIGGRSKGKFNLVFRFE